MFLEMAIRRKQDGEYKIEDVDTILEKRTESIDKTGERKNFSRDWACWAPTIKRSGGAVAGHAMVPTMGTSSHNSPT